MRKNKNIKFEEESIDLVNLLSNLWKGKRLIINITFIFFLLGILYSFSIENSYKASSLFYPHVEKINKSNNLQDLAGLAGINIRNEISNDIPSTLYPNIINSPVFKTELLNNFIFLDGENIMYRKYLNDKLKSSYSIKKLILSPIRLFTNTSDINKNISSNNGLNIIKLSNDEFKLHKYLSEIIILNLNEKEGFIELSVEENNPNIASQIAEISKNILQKNIIDFKLKNINDLYLFISDQLEISKNNFYVLQDSLAKFKDNNRNIKSDLFLNQYSRIESEFNISKNLYNELSLNKQKTEIDVRKNTPIFTVIKPVVLPNEKEKPNRIFLIILFTTIGLISSSLYVAGKDSIKSFLKEINS